MFSLDAATSWLQFVILLVSVVTIGIKVGRFTGQQEQINKNQDEKNKSFDKQHDQHTKDIGYIKEDINIIRTDIGVIKNTLKIQGEGGK
jgi:hypothetical protein